MIFVVPELFATVAATAGRRMLVQVALEAAVGAVAAQADRAAERVVFTGHRSPPLPCAGVSSGGTQKVLPAELLR